MHGPDFQAINSSIHQAVQPPQGGGQLPPHLVQLLMYALQAADAVKSGQLFQHPSTYETNPMMKPFSHGGAPTMALGFGLGDILRNALLRHASQGTRNTADILQGLSNVQGIAQTQHALNSQPRTP